MTEVSEVPEGMNPPVEVAALAAAGVSPCDWPLDVSVLSGNTVWEGHSPEVRAAAHALATEFLWQWSGRVFGLCPATLRPCDTAPRQWPSQFGYPVPTVGGHMVWSPVQVGAGVHQLVCGSCVAGACTCSRYDSIRLPRTVHEVVEVREGGVPLPGSAWTFVTGVLYRIDGGVWPTVQDVAAPDTDADVWELDVLYGRPVPHGGRVAAAVLADQLARAMTNSQGCQLPERIQSVSREGVSVAVMDTFEDLQKGGTGIWLVDSWLQSVSQPSRRWTVASPDTRRTGREVRGIRVR